MEKSHEGIIVLDEEGSALYANPMATLMLSRTEDSPRRPVFDQPICSRPSDGSAHHRSDGEPGFAGVRVGRTEWKGQPACLATHEGHYGSQEGGIRTAEARETAEGRAGARANFWQI